MNVLSRLLVTLLILVSTTTQASDWDQIVEQASGKTLYFHAWGGDENINDYIRWAGNQVKSQYGITVKHVKNVAPNAVSQVLAEKTAGKNQGGAVDLIWINGENFAAMKANGLLYGSFTQDLPNYALVDTENKPTTLFDFTTPVDNLEAPWGMAQLIFMYDSAQVRQPPESAQSLLAFAESNPNRFTYPAPPAFHGTTFVKQMLLELTDQNPALYKPVGLADFDELTAPLWAYLDELHPLMWQQGKTFTDGAPRMKQLLNDGEIDISLSFNPFEASSAIANGELPDSVRTYIHNSGTIGNSHFVTIPFNASQPAAAMVFANFLMSPEAQARKANPNIWGDPTVLNIRKLDSAGAALFNNLPKGVATLSNEALSNVLREPHASWVEALEQAWLSRYGN